MSERYVTIIANGTVHYQCKGCGCIVGDTGQHDVWHRFLDAIIAQAGER